MLPSSGTSTYSSHSTTGRSISNGSLYLRRLTHFAQMDFEYTFTQMVFLLSDPRRVYKLNSWRSQTKGQWARDDPAFVVSLCCLIGAGSMAFAAARGLRPVGVVLTHLSVFFGSGVLIASILWWISNNHCRIRHSHSVDQKVEWLYAFDVHCNAYFPLFVVLYVLQFLLLPLLDSESRLSAFVANTLYCCALCYYHYISFLGYLFLPFLNKKLVTSMLYPIAVIIVVTLVLTLLRLNMTMYVLNLF